MKNVVEFGIPLLIIAGLTIVALGGTLGIPWLAKRRDRMLERAWTMASKEARWTVTTWIEADDTIVGVALVAHLGRDSRMLDRLEVARIHGDKDWWDLVSAGEIEAQQRKDKLNRLLLSDEM